MNEAIYYKSLEGGKVKCQLCPHSCVLENQEQGICKVRTNRDGVLIGDNYGKVTAIHVDPIEKKPLYHFYPGSKILSIGSYGCTMKCLFCQNCDISQASTGKIAPNQSYSAQSIINLAAEKLDIIGIAFTYNEPTTWYEFMLAIAEKANVENFKTVMVTNGYIHRKPLEKLIPCIDAFNVDLKSFTERFYQLVTQSALEPVKKAIKMITAAKKHLEITNLVVPKMNDDEAEFEEMVKWIAGETGERTVLHISRYFPNYQMNMPSTPIETLNRLYEIAQKHLKHVYLGNVSDKDRNSTYCDKCGKLLIDRSTYGVEIKGLDLNGNCIKCGNHVIDHCLMSK